MSFAPTSTLLILPLLMTSHFNSQVSEYTKCRVTCTHHSHLRLCCSQWLTLVSICNIVRPQVEGLYGNDTILPLCASYMESSQRPKHAKKWGCTNRCKSSHSVRFWRLHILNIRTSLRRAWLGSGQLSDFRFCKYM